MEKGDGCGLMNFLIHFISGKSDNGGFTFDEHVLHFLCGVASTETVVSCLNFEKVVDYVVKTSRSKFKYDVKLTDLLALRADEYDFCYFV